MLSGNGGERKPGRHNAPPVDLGAPTAAHASQAGFRPQTKLDATAETTEQSQARAARVAHRILGRMRLYVPQNAALYNAALIGFIAGCNQARTIGSSTTGLVAQSVLFAQAVDTAIPFDAALNQSKIDLLTEIVSNVFGDLYPQGFEGASYSATATAVVALYNAAVTALAAIAPPGGGSPPASLVFRPGGVTAGNVYATEAALAAATVALTGAAYVITFDLSLVAGTHTFTTVGSWAIAPNGSWEGSATGSGGTLVFANGTTIPGSPCALPSSVTNLAISVTQITDVCTVPAAQPRPLLVFGLQSSLNAAALAGSWLANNSGSTADVLAQDDAALGGAAGATPLFTNTRLALVDSAGAGLGTIAAGSLVTLGSSGVTLDASLYAFAIVESVFVDLTGTAVAGIPAGGSTGYIFDATTGFLWWSFAAAWINIPADGVSYTPSGPDTGILGPNVQAAIDSLTIPGNEFTPVAGGTTDINTRACPAIGPNSQIFSSASAAPGAPANIVLQGVGGGVGTGGPTPMLLEWGFGGIDPNAFMLNVGVDPSVAPGESAPTVLAPGEAQLVQLGTGGGLITAGGVWQNAVPTVDATPTVILTYPLSGSGQMLGGLTSVDVRVLMQSQTTADAAEFRLSAAWTITPGTTGGVGTPLQAAPVAPTGFPKGTNAFAPPIGWAVTVTLDGGGTNIIVTVTGDVALAVNSRCWLTPGLAI